MEGWIAVLFVASEDAACNRINCLLSDVTLWLSCFVGNIGGWVLKSSPLV